MTERAGVRSGVKQKGVVSRTNQEEVQFVGLLLEVCEGFRRQATTPARQPRSQHTLFHGFSDWKAKKPSQDISRRKEISVPVSTARLGEVLLGIW